MALEQEPYWWEAAPRRLAASEPPPDLIRREGIDCHLQKCGRFIAALSPRHYEEMVRMWDLRSRKLGDLFEPVARADQHREIASDLYHGGLVIPDHHSLRPALYHQGLLERATEAGARAAGDTPVLAIARDGANLELLTSRGRLQAREVLIATNGYTGKATPHLRRRIVPFHGFMAATQPLPSGLLRRVLPNGRIFHDSFDNLIYMRPGPRFRAAPVRRAERPADARPCGQGATLAGGDGPPASRHARDRFQSRMDGDLIGPQNRGILLG